MRRLLLPLLLAGRLHGAEPLPGHSVHGEAFDEGPRQAAVLIEGCGKVSFPITSKNAEAQKFFNQGVGQLHGFWYFEAERSFRQVAALDPECAIAYWGCAMANVNNEKRAAAFIKKATEKKDKASKREQAWMATLSTFYADLKKDKKARHMDFIKDMEGIVHEYPEDLEARAFLAWSIWHAREASVPMVSRESVDAVIQQVFAKEPMHPAHHYIIHLWDDQKASRAVASAERCGQSAPAIAHMWHMPGHTFSKTNRLADAAWQQEAATRVDHAYMMRTQILPDQIHNYAHNTEWLVRTLSQTGQAREAIAIAKNLIEIPRHPAYNTLGKKDNSAAYGRTRLLETLLKYELWDEVLALEGSPLIDKTQNPSYEANWQRALGVAAYFKGNKADLQKRLAALEGLKKLPPAPPVAAETIKPAALKTTVPEKKPAKVEEKKEGNDKDKDKKKDPGFVINNAVAELKALAAILDKKEPAAIQKLLDEIKDSPKERLVRYQMAVDNKTKAAALALQLPLDAPGLAVRVQTLKDCGKTDEAKKHFETLRKTGAALDADLPFSARLDAIAVELGLPEEWRSPAPASKLAVVRPPLDSLGPLAWSPFPSAGFELEDAAGNRVNLKSQNGKPAVVLFYLGHSCGPCLEQLKSFAHAARDYEHDGIDIVAIGSERRTDLSTTASSCDPEAGAPFRLLADPEMKVFRAWRCYDDFEGMPLHGAFLIDGKGLVRWMDVSYEPFTDAAFLLGEAKRLLGLE